MISNKNKPLFRVLVKPKASSKKVLFFLTSYKVPWYVYKFSIMKFKKGGYEVVIYDLNDYILDNDDPKVLLKAVEDINGDISARISAYKSRGISIFDAIGNSLGSFFVYNYAVRYPLRRIVLNTGGYMARIIFNSTDRRLGNTRQRYQEKGFDLQSLEVYWKAIDAPELGRNLKSEETFMLASLKDKHIANDATDELIANMSKSKTKLMVSKNARLRHSAAVITNAHSGQIKQFLLK
jgi:pimeloyl-ACP methyl ester carboxylesterase